MTPKKPSPTKRKLVYVTREGLSKKQRKELEDYETRMAARNARKVASGSEAPPVSSTPSLDSDLEGSRQPVSTWSNLFFF